MCVRDFVKKLMWGFVKVCGYCIDRGNVFVNVYCWILIIYKNDLKIVDKYCFFFYLNLGYK